jgi:hypothetical protein
MDRGAAGRSEPTGTKGLCKSLLYAHASFRATPSGVRFAGDSIQQPASILSRVKTIDGLLAGANSPCLVSL